MPLVTGKRRRPLLVDLFCGAGGCSVGYYRAGFDVVGIDILRRCSYPYRYWRADVLNLTVAKLRKYFSSVRALAASPPCKVHTCLKAFSGDHHTNLIPFTRGLLEESGLPWIIENVPGAPLRNPLVLCGSMFGLDVRRHRLFELKGFAVEPLPCNHAVQDADKKYMVASYHGGKKLIPSGVIGIYGRGQGLGKGEVRLWRKAMGISWMTQGELSQAIPPAYTEYIGKQLLASINRGGA